MNRAYSLLEIKAVDESEGVITGFATTPTPDRLGDVVEPDGARFKLPMPLLWQHDSRRPIGLVTAAKVTKDGIEIAATVARDLDRDIARAWKLIKAGLVRGLSIGFSGLDHEVMAEGGLRFKEWEWLELSTVTIPANAEASIQTIKSIDREFQRAATGKAAGPVVSKPGDSGKPVVKPVSAKESHAMGTEKKSLAEQIAAFEATRAAKAARMEEIMDGAAETGETLDKEQEDEFETLAGEVKAVDSHLTRLRLMEREKAATAKAVEKAASPEEASAARDPARLPATVKRSETLKPGIRFARVVKCLGLAQGNRSAALEIAKTMYQHDEQVVTSLKAAVAAGTVGGATWAGPLVGSETSVFADFVEFLRPMTILGKFGAGGIPALRSVPFRTALVGQTSGGAGYWVGENAPKGLTDFDFSRTTLAPLKVANIAVLSEEVIRDSSPSAETIVRDQLAEALATRQDVDFVDPGKGASAGVSPASISNGVTAVNSVGNSADSIREDVRAILATFIAANNSPTSGVWIMRSTVALALSLLVNALGQQEFPGITMNGGTFAGLPVITSEHMPTATAGDYVLLAKASDIYFADEGGVTIDMSREASLQMDSAPANPPTASTVFVSLWQQNLVGFLAERTVNWAKRRASAVAVLDQVNWGEPGT